MERIEIIIVTSALSRKLNADVTIFIILKKDFVHS